MCVFRPVRSALFTRPYALSAHPLADVFLFFSRRKDGLIGQAALTVKDLSSPQTARLPLVSNKGGDAGELSFQVHGQGYGSRGSQYSGSPLNSPRAGGEQCPLLTAGALSSLKQHLKVLQEGRPVM